MCFFPQSNNNNIKNKKAYEDVELVRHKIVFLVGNAASSTCDDKDQKTKNQDVEEKG